MAQIYDLDEMECMMFNVCCIKIERAFQFSKSGDTYSIDDFESNSILLFIYFKMMESCMYRRHSKEYLVAFSICMFRFHFVEI